MQKIAVFTSGGDAPGMNACIRAVVLAAQHHQCEVVGIRNGYRGMIEGDFIPLDPSKVQTLIREGGTMLGSARSPQFRQAEGRKKAFQHLQNAEIEGVIAIGGDGTFTGAQIFMQEHKLPFVGIPGTIDNDLFGTDFTLGYDTAINTAMEALDKIRDTAQAHGRIFLVEVMGRDAGFIALRAALAAGAEALLIPETPTDIPLLAQRLKTQAMAIVVVAEGDEAGNAFQIAAQLKPHIPDFDLRVTVLGHLQRGGRPTCMDRVLANELGIAAVQRLLDGKKGIMVGKLHRSIAEVPFAEAIKHHQQLPHYLQEMLKVLHID